MRAKYATDVARGAVLPTSLVSNGGQTGLSRPPTDNTVYCPAIWLVHYSSARTLHIP